MHAPATLSHVFGWPLTSRRQGQILGAYVAGRFPGQKAAIAYTSGQGRAEIHANQEVRRTV